MTVVLFQETFSNVILEPLIMLMKRLNKKHKIKELTGFIQSTEHCAMHQKFTFNTVDGSIVIGPALFILLTR